MQKILNLSGIICVNFQKAGFVIEIKRDGNYIDNETFPLEEVVKRAKAWQKTGREDLLLILDESIPIKRVDEVREALRKTNVYHVNQRPVNSDEIIYPASDVTKLAEFSKGNFGEWMREQLKPYLEDIPKDQEYFVPRECLWRNRRLKNLLNWNLFLYKCPSCLAI